MKLSIPLLIVAIFNYFVSTMETLIMKAGTGFKNTAYRSGILCIQNAINQK